MQTYRTAARDIDQIILRNFPQPGVFIEAGGSHPIDASNTYLLEQKGWSGLVVEPRNNYNSLYQQIRPNTILENYVLVENSFAEPSIEGDFSMPNLGGVINVREAANWKPEPFPCTQLHRLLKKHEIHEVHFFSLDVEGYEKEVLFGVDFEEVFFHIIVVEHHRRFGWNLPFEEAKRRGAFSHQEMAHDLLLKKGFFCPENFDRYCYINSQSEISQKFISTLSS